MWCLSRAWPSGEVSSFFITVPQINMWAWLPRSSCLDKLRSGNPFRSSLRSQRVQHSTQTFHQIHDLAFAVNVKFNFVVSCRSVVNCFLQAQQRLDHLTRQNVTDPNADEQRQHGNDGEGPFRL